MIIEALIQAVIYTTTAIATLRAGSRTLYAFQHHNEIGTMDGPLILSPHDLVQLQEQGDTDAEISPLWEYAYAFGESVRLLHDADHISSVDVFVGDWKEEENLIKNHYSMSSPQKILQYQGIAGKQDRHIRQQHLSRSNRTEGSSFKNSMQTKSPYISKGLNFFKSSLSEILKYHPLFQNFFNRQNRDIDVSDDESSVADLDFDIFYAKTLKIPISSATNCSDTEMNHHIANIRSYAPNAFRKLRTRFGVSESSFLTSILDRGPYVSFQSNSKGAARAGGFFFFTRDGAYMIKTIKKAEVKAILNMLPKYYNFMKLNSRRSLLTRFCGLYSIQLGEENAIHDEEERFFLIMNSVFPAEGGKFISERYDLKGSTVGRECSKEERETKGSFAVLKDLDLAKEVEVIKSVSKSFQIPGYGICIGPTAKASLLEQLRRDLSLLVECSVMDYSLLVGVVNMEANDDTPQHPDIHRHVANVKSNYDDNTRNEMHVLLNTLSAPIHLLCAPGLFICQKGYNLARNTLSTVLTLPLPYYGAGVCGVDGGALSIIPGKRLGKRAVYYLGVIDFLQPWTAQKVLERELKSVIGYDKTQISCIDPKEYADRFLDFMDKHIS
jgi:1-phosphatidylinositol-4-phosphate 5-kinase